MQPKVDLMYRPPGRTHIKLTDALDELYARVEALEKNSPAPEPKAPKRNFFLQLLTLWH